MNILVTLGKIDVQTLATVGIVAAIFVGIALLLVLAILLVNKVFKVQTDEKVTKILENLAGANCGGCGCAGCSNFAEKLASGKGSLNDCCVTANENKAEIAKILGVNYENQERTVAVVLCNGGKNAKNDFIYSGKLTCAEKAKVQGGDKICKFSCLGCGDCVRVCPENAIAVTDGVAVINPDKCVSCGACILDCPKQIIARVPETAPVYCACSSLCRGKEVTIACEVGCIGCGLCAKKCPHGAITMVDNLPVFDYKKCTGCKTCVAVCPRKIIKERF